jgi:hypothetical protein
LLSFELGHRKIQNRPLEPKQASNRPAIALARLLVRPRLARLRAIRRDRGGRVGRALWQAADAAGQVARSLMISNRIAVRVNMAARAALGAPSVSSSVRLYHCS